MQARTQKDIVFNLSSKTIPKETLERLNLGLNFVPTPLYNPLRKRIDLYRLFCNIKLRNFFGNTDTNKDIPVFKKKSTFTPNVQDPSIIVFERLLTKDLTSLEATNLKHHFNLSRHQLQLLQNLSNDPSIVIKPADKGGGIVILDTDMYHNEVMRQLNDSSSYVKLTSDPTRSIMNLEKVTVHEALSLDFITKDISDYLINEHPRVPRFYLLPKIHKPDFPPRGRPIVATQDSILENISKFVDYLLQPHVKSIRTYLQDTRDFILKVENITVPP